VPAGALEVAQASAASPIAWRRDPWPIPTAW
jgi:hypothetical protein